MRCLSMRMRNVSQDSENESANKWCSYDQCYKQYYLDGKIRDPYVAFGNFSHRPGSLGAPLKLAVAGKKIKQK